MTQLIWNGCDGYMDIDSAHARAYDITHNADGTATLYHGAQSYTSFEAEQLDTAPEDMGGLYATEDGRVFRAK